MKPLLSSSVDTTESTDPISSERESVHLGGVSEVLRFFKETQSFLDLFWTSSSASASVLLSASSSEEREEPLICTTSLLVPKKGRFVPVELRPMPNRRASAATNSSIRKLRRSGCGGSFTSNVAFTEFVEFGTNPTLWIQLVLVLAKDDDTKGMDADRDNNRGATGVSGTPP